MAGPKGEYEDSAQKRERLETEYVSILKEIEDLIKLSLKDSENVTEAFEKSDSMNEKIDKLQSKSRRLETGLRKMESRKAPEEEIDSRRDEIMKTWNEIDSLREELLKMIEDETGLEGDYEGTQLAARMKWQTLDKIRQEIAELDKQDGL